ncbi:hypothetical protein LGM75_26550, partial [Burkholderia multivorans]|uniref:hypothetical protein n=1 Tax=Burkholderia multivorans TaxID=87883 RepID=UPI001C24BDA3
ADCVRLEIGNEPVCYPVRRAIYAGTWITRCSIASPTKMRTGSAASAFIPFERLISNENDQMVLHTRERAEMPSVVAEAEKTTATSTRWPFFLWL